MKPVLDPEASAALRDQLLTDVDRLSSRCAATWAHRIMAAKNSLAAADARRVEDAVPGEDGNPRKRRCRGDQCAFGHLNQANRLRKIRAQQSRAQRSVSNSVDKSRSRYRNRVGFATRPTSNLSAKQPCLICGRRPSDPHHLRFAQHRCTRAQGERRIHRAVVSRPSSRGAPLR